MGGGWAVSAPLLCQNLFWCVGFSFSLSLEVSVIIRPLAHVLTVLCNYSSGKAGAVTSQLCLWKEIYFVLQMPTGKSYLEPTKLNGNE